MDRPKEIKMNKLWDLCMVPCMRFNPNDRPNFTEIRERLEKIIDKCQRQLPIARVLGLFGAPPVLGNDPDSDSIGENDYTEVYYGYVSLNKTNNSSAYSSASSSIGIVTGHGQLRDHHDPMDTYGDIYG